MKAGFSNEDMRMRDGSLDDDCTGRTGSWWGSFKALRRGCLLLAHHWRDGGRPATGHHIYCSKASLPYTGCTVLVETNEDSCSMMWGVENGGKMICSW